MTGIAYRAVSLWTDPETPHAERLSHYQFKATANATRTLLLQQGRLLRASEVVVELVAPESSLYVDGSGLRADRANSVTHVGVVVRLVGTEHGDLRYATDRFTAWAANLRAITLALADLRRLDRYGVATRGEQYRGWAALGAGTPMGGGERPKMTVDYAAAVLAGATEGMISAPDVLRDPEDAKTAYRLAAKRYHPDASGGSTEVWGQVDEAWQLVERHHEGRL
jgi:hypothetical protein